MSPVPSPEFDADRFNRIAATLPEIDRLAAEFVDKHHLPGLAYGVIAGGQLIHAGGVGLADITATLPVSRRTLFRIASMTKSFVAVAILQLRDGGLLGLDDPVARYVPELALLASPTTDAPPLTLRHLLTMNAGWPEDNPWGDRQLALDDAALSALLVQGVTFASSPNTQYEYSNLAYMILGKVVHQVSGQPFQEYTAQHILQPLGMLNARWNLDQVDQSVARGYRLIDGEFVEEPDAWAPCGGDAAGFGGLYLSVDDLAKWVAFFLSAWPPRDGVENPVLHRSSLREMQRCANLRPPPASAQPIGRPLKWEVGGYAFGLFAAETTEFGRLVGHAGGLSGFGSHMVWLPDRDIGVATLSNCTYAPAVASSMQILHYLVTNAQLASRPVQPHPALLSAQTDVIRLMQRWDDTLADALMAVNFFLDTPRDVWRQRFESLHRRHGVLQVDGEIEIRNPLRGQWKMRGERGWCTIWITLTPTVPPRVQHLSIDSILPLEDKMQKTLKDVLAATAKPTLRAVNRMFAPEINRREMLTHLRVVNLLYGAPTLESIIGGDGVERCVARVRSDRGVLELTITLHLRTGKVRHAEFRSAA